MKNFMLHIHHALRYGDWDCGWEMYEDKPMFGLYKIYYDGDHVALHLYKFWVAVSY